ncbi:hypothetical protein F2Q68_00010375 [Brassica cretica]|uniref:Uncharacterized protein n=1 Tax=Brassica cretica TaxID=69181 RepID=A0A8S9L046_BRACR|nr:hypothetical protein F2Q68_00010375 [Brassica cretica]
MMILEPFECKVAQTLQMFSYFEVNQHPVAEVMHVLLKSGGHTQFLTRTRRAKTRLQADHTQGDLDHQIIPWCVRTCLSLAKSLRLDSKSAKSRGSVSQHQINPILHNIKREHDLMGGIERMQPVTRSALRLDRIIHRLGPMVSGHTTDLSLLFIERGTGNYLGNRLQGIGRNGATCPLHLFAQNRPKTVHNHPPVPLAVSSIENYLLGLCPSLNSNLDAHGPIVPHELPAQPSNCSAPTTLFWTGTLRQAEMSCPQLSELVHQLQ